MTDYILGKLLRKQQICESFGDIEHRRFFVLMRREYIVRFLLAVLYDLNFEKCSSADKTDITHSLFSIRVKPALGVFKDAIRKLAEHLPKSDRNKVNKLVLALSECVISNRNKEDHLLTADNDQAIEIIENWIKLVEECRFSFFPSEAESDTEFDFLIPIKAVDGHNVLCACFKEGEIMPVAIPEVHFHTVVKRKVIIGKLFYRVMKNNEPIRIYQLSPFVHYYDNPLKGIFTIYSHTIERSYHMRISARSIFDEQTGNVVKNDLLSGKVCVSSIPNDGFVEFSDKGNFFHSDYCEVNRSSYADFQRATEAEFLYDEQIIKEKWDQLMAFCKNGNSPNCIITGSGGIGKTAMLLRLVHKYMSGEMKNSVQRIIFLSAKKYSLAQDVGYNMSSVEVSSDITCYKDFIRRFIQYSRDLSPEEAINEGATEYLIDEKEILSYIEEDNQRLLLLLDDFDSLPQEEAEKIYRFTLLLPPEKVKTIITTRDLNMAGTERIELTVFNKEQSCEFAVWLFDVKNMLNTWGSMMKKNEYRDGLWQQTQGYPIFIMAWVEKACAGMPVKVNTGRQIYSLDACIEYLYGSILARLTPETCAVLSIAIAFILRAKDKAVDEDVLYYLSPVETRDEMNEHFRQLIAYRLLRRNRIKDRNLELLDFDYNDIPITLTDKYEEYMNDPFFSTSIFRSLEVDPQEWGDPHMDIKRIISYIHNKESLSWPESLFLSKLYDDVIDTSLTHILSRDEMDDVVKMMDNRKRKTWNQEEFEFFIGGAQEDEYDAEKIKDILDKLSKDRASVYYKPALTMIIHKCESYLKAVSETAEIDVGSVEKDIVYLGLTFPSIFSKITDLIDKSDTEMEELWNKLRISWRDFNEYL